MEEDEALEVDRAHALHELVRQRRQVEREEVRGDGHCERFERVCGGESVEVDWVVACLREQRCEERLLGQDVLVDREAVALHCVYGFGEDVVRRAELVAR